jgi:hypothetical protein
MIRIINCETCGSVNVDDSVHGLATCPSCGAEDPVTTGKLVNLTPHQVDIHCLDWGRVSVPPSGQLARCTQTEVARGHIGGIIGVTEQEFGEVVGLPEPKSGTWLIVSRLVKAAVPHRNDVVVPGPAIRDDQGRIVGCQGVSL